MTVACSVSCWAPAVLAAAWVGLALPARADPLERPARPSALAAQRLVAGLSDAGAGRLAAAGQRGHILLSEDGGARWSQAQVPVSSDLTALQFLGGNRALAIGHDGVLLASEDGGRTWRRQLDGNAINTLALEQLKAAAPDAEQARLLMELERNQAAGPDKPLLDLCIAASGEGFIVGAFNLLLHTADGGRSWQSWYARSDNTAKLLNLYAVRQHRGQWFIAGEAGLLMRLDPARQRFVRVDTGYQGSFFGLLDAGDALIVHGMRGNAVASRDGGRTWSPLATGLSASIIASARGPDGSLWLADQTGSIAVSRDGGIQFKSVPIAARQPVAALLATDTSLVLAGARGVRSIPLPRD